YPEGSGGGAGDVVALDEATGEVLASGFSDRKRGGRYRIELPAGHHVRLVAHPLHQDTILLKKDFLDSNLVTPGGFEPTELLDRGQTAIVTVPERSTQEVPPLMVTPPADPPLLNDEVLSLALLPGERRRVSFQFKGLTPASAQV